MKVTPGLLDSLAAKLDGLDLIETEQAILDAVLERARTAEPEVEGFYLGFELDDVTIPTARKLIEGLWPNDQGSQSLEGDR